MNYAMFKKAFEDYQDVQEVHYNIPGKENWTENNFKNLSSLYNYRNDKAFLDEWWRRHKANGGTLDRTTVEQELNDAIQRGLNDASKYKSKGSWWKNAIIPGYDFWKQIGAMRKSNELAAQGIKGNTPYERMMDIAYTNAFRNGEPGTDGKKGKEGLNQLGAEAFDRDVAEAQNILGHTASGLTFGLSNAAVKLGDKVYGNKNIKSDIDSTFKGYVENVRNNFGDEEAKRRGRALAFAGGAGELAGGLLLGGAIKGAVKGGLTIGKTGVSLYEIGKMQNAAKYAQQLGMNVNTLQKLGNFAHNAVKWRPIGEALSTVTNTITANGMDMPESKWLAVPTMAAQITGDIMKGSPAYAMAGAGASKLTSYVSGLTLPHGTTTFGEWLSKTKPGQYWNSAKAWAASKPAVDAVNGATAAAKGATGAAAQGATAAADAAAGAVVKGTAATATGAVGKAAEKTLGQYVKGALVKPVKWMVSDVTSGPAYGLVSDVQNIGQGNFKEVLSPGNITTHLGITGAVAPMLINGTVKQMSPTWRALSEGASYSAKLDDTLNAFDSSPEARNGVRQELESVYGISTEGMDDAALRKLYTEQYMPDMRYAAAMERALHKADSSFDLSNATQEQVQQKWQSLPPEERSKRKFKALMDDAVQGGPMSLQVFMDEDLTPKQRRELLEKSIASEYAGKHGKWHTVFTSDKKILERAMQENPTVRSLVVHYGAGQVQDMLMNPGKSISMDKTMKVALDNMTAEDKKNLLKPLQMASTDTIMNYMAADKLGDVAGIQGMTEALSSVISDRLSNDGNFAAEFIPAYQNAIKEGKNLQGADPSMVKDIISGVDPYSMMATMDDNHFKDFTRYMLSNRGATDLAGAMPADKFEELQQSFQDAAKQRVQMAVMQNPLKNLPMAAQLWAQSRGWGGVGNVIGNPVGFYGILALLLGGGAWLTHSVLKDKSEQQAQTPQSLMVDMIRQRGAAM